MVAYAFNLCTWQAEAGESEFKGSLVYRVSSRTARATQGNPVSGVVKKKNKNKKQHRFLCSLWKHMTIVFAQCTF